ncbi:hypothetical protein [Parabacteroides sp. PFB2-10]|uniref:hypothetical protein n=1 Tax=Parabacteroides sp. PFB2-10 TaxID=1742405 RepID=UPI002474EF36|nr:hypothetical protein [Parabacteroides sp. PFB2-10]MDL2245290.1 hypothetical protein [Parabacteroides sp. OttesenSCG-928-J18]
MIACTEATLQEKTKETKGILHVYPEWEEQEVTPVLNTHLYQMEATPLHLETASSEYSITTEAGIYSLISHNTNTLGLDFTDLDDYHQAKATAIRVDQTKTDAKELLPSENAFRLAVESAMVTAEEETIVHSRMYALTRTLFLQFSVTNGDEYQRISGMLEGVYYAVYLATGLPVGDETDWKIPFDIELSEDNTATAVIHLLGLYNPSNGTHYHNKMHVVLEDDESNTYWAEVDLSEVITDILDSNKGDIPIDIPVEIEVELEVIDGGLTATVKPWEEGKGTGDITE